MPYLRYVAVQDARTRPDHMAWHGTVLPVGHPWWATHNPPNGWRCRCTVVQLAERDLRRYGYRVSPDPAVRDREWTNRRSGEVQRIPEGIDPGFAHNVGLLDPGVDGHRILREKAEAAGLPGAAGGLDRFLAAGREEKARLLRDAGGIDDPAFPARMRERLRAGLAARRGAGTVEADVRDVPQAPDPAAAVAAADRVRRAARDLPASWVAAANARGAVLAEYNGRRYGGEYVFQDRIARVSDDPGAALHEYCHHLQLAMPGLQRVFRDDHVRRTTAGGRRDPVVDLPDYPGHRGRPDLHLDAYAGKVYDYDWPRSPPTGHRTNR